MDKRITSAIALSALTLLGSACSPHYQANLVNDDPLEGMTNSSREQERNRAAFEELRARAAAAEPRAREPEPADDEWEVAAPAAPLPPAFRDDGSLRRAAVQEVIDRGAQMLLVGLDLDPIRTSEGDVMGFQLSGIFPDADFIRSTGLQEGDIVTRLNGRRVTDPEVFFRTWTTIPEQEMLWIQISREGREFHFEWLIRSDD